MCRNSNSIGYYWLRNASNGVQALGDGSVAQHVLGPLTGNPSFQNFHSVAAGFGFAVAMGVWIAGGVSGTL